MPPEQLSPKYLDGLRSRYAKLSPSQLRKELAALNAEQRPLLTQYFAYAAQSQELGLALRRSAFEAEFNGVPVEIAEVRCVVDASASDVEAAAAAKKLRAAGRVPSRVFLDPTTGRSYFVL